MYIYLISQKSVTGYDTYSAAVVVAEDEESAKKIHPSPHYTYSEEYKCFGFDREFLGFELVNCHNWPNTTRDIKVKLIGYAADNQKAGDVILADFHAG